MRSLLFLLTTVLFSPLHAQISYEDALSELSRGLNDRIISHASTTVLVTPFKQVDGVACSMSNTLTLDLETALAELTLTYKLLDRQNFEALSEEHRLEMNGMMDEEQRMREAGRLLKADVIIIGYFTYAADVLILRAKAVDVQTAEQVAVLSRRCTPSGFLKGLCKGSNEVRQIGTEGGTLGKNQEPTRTPAPLPTGPAVSPDCATKNLGSYCFKNNGTKEIHVHARFPSPYGRPGPEQLVVRPGRSECFMDKTAGSYQYTIVEIQFERHPVYPVNNTKTVGQGTMRIQACGMDHYRYP